MKAFILLTYLFLLSTLLFSQEEIRKKTPVFIICNMGTGLSDIKGYSVLLSAAVERNQHTLTFNWNLNNQVGDKDKAFLVYYRYNDRFREFSLLYGYTLRSSQFLFTVSGGVGYYKYLLKTRGIYLQQFLGSHYEVNKKIYYGNDLVCQLKFAYLFSYDSGLGICFQGNTGAQRSVVGVTLNLFFGILKQ